MYLKNTDKQSYHRSMSCFLFSCHSLNKFKWRVFLKWHFIFRCTGKMCFLLSRTKWHQQNTQINILELEKDAEQQCEVLTAFLTGVSPNLVMYWKHWYFHLSRMAGDIWFVVHESFTGFLQWPDHAIQIQKLFWKRPITKKWGMIIFTSSNLRLNALGVQQGNEGRRYTAVPV